ncbi:nitroreductase family deazaflavin-dependent oxidoreductase [Sporichthya sp.]|uniref:nitroreductase family deazaflavin-dependent oxidoreductase n=1 Tax=Sporichthya sp. TaxID=65475 RepID=UPI00180F1008|nr:nitroreductase family deazaflavin-dependent oxidoreductase [Sporichthya sp.]MBA3742919.1 nitroreductase family deazaflavin-dependent oxidoreductase [Sporichthya sp.]
MSKQNNVVAGVGAWVLETGHRTLLTLTGGRFPKRLGGMETLELHTIGRKSGQRRSTLLTTPIFDDRRVIVVASKGGHDEHPDWYKNLAANPDVEITLAGETRKMRARTAAPAEKAELWPQIVKVYSGYAGYQQRSDRDIPVVICEAVD